jgi:hypothetical protein
MIIITIIIDPLTTGFQPILWYSSPLLQVQYTCAPFLPYTCTLISACSSTTPIMHRVFSSPPTFQSRCLSNNRVRASSPKAVHYIADRPALDLSKHVSFPGRNRVFLEKLIVDHWFLLYMKPEVLLKHLQQPATGHCP